jgi:hypothetical protein
MKLTGRNPARRLPSKTLQNKMPRQCSLNKCNAKIDPAGFV